MSLFLISGSSFIDPTRNVHSTNIVSLAALLSSGKHIKQIYRLVSKNPKRQYNLIVSRIPKQHIDNLSIKNPHHHMMSSHSSNSIHTISFQKVDLRSKFPPPFDQGSLGSCTANALCGVIAYDIPGFIGSRLFLYYNERYIENDVKNDGGAMLSDGVESLKIYGICPESDWKYDISKFSVKPSQKCYKDAVSHHAVNVKNINNTMKDMKNALSNGYPFVVGITIYESFESDDVEKTGMVNMPSPSESCYGGHAVVCVGYDDEKKIWIMRNSWGSKWGDGGYFYLPYAYLLSDDLASDLWCVTKME
jgi:C1A family cysteine protease